MEVLEKDVFKGGIKKGTIATDAAAAKLDKQCKNARDLLSAELSIIYGSLLQMKKSIPGTAKRVGCVPDGGLWYYKGRLIGQILAGYGKAFGMRVLMWGSEASRERAAKDGLNPFLFRDCPTFPMASVGFQKLARR